MDTETKRYLEEQFSKMTTKDDLAALESRMATKDDLATLRSDVNSLGSNVGEMINGLATHIDERFEEAERIEKLLRTPQVRRDLEREKDDEK